jgi:hypothetical protein
LVKIQAIHVMQSSLTSIYHRRNNPCLHACAKIELGFPAHQSFVRGR